MSALQGGDLAFAPDAAAAAEASIGAPLPIAGSFVRLFLDSARLEARDEQAVLRRAGIDRLQLDAAGFRVTEACFTRFLVLLSRRSGDEAWGLASRRVPLGTFHTLCRLIVNCRTLGEALVVVGRFYRLVVDDIVLKLRREDGQVVVFVKPLRPLTAERDRNLQGATLFLLYQFMCWLVDRRIALTCVDFSHARRPSSSESLLAYETHTIRFDQPWTALRMQAHLTSLPIIGDADRLSRFLSQAPHALLTRYHDESRVGDRVRSILRGQVGVPLSLEDVAARLHLTPVTLRRHLAAEGCRRFSDLRDDVRRKAALEMVQQGHLKLEAIAIRLGFAEYSTFHRAFRRWTGHSPSDFRASPSAG